MPKAITAEKTLRVGIPNTLEGPSPSRAFSTVFEDDGQTGYFYGLDLEKDGNLIIDGMQIYNAACVVDKDRPSLFQIIWSSDGFKSALLINGYAHALFDFEGRRGYCRANFPPPNRVWTTFDHAWCDEAMLLLH